MKRKQKCKICGKRFNVIKDKVYIVIETQGFAAALSTPAKKYDAIDCPRCGCQQVLWVRMPRLTNKNCGDQPEQEIKNGT